VALAELEKSDCSCQSEKLSRITLDVKDESVNVSQGWKSNDKNGGNIMHDETPERGIERARGREQTGVRKESLAGYLLVHSCL
jgi:hypothetical protein